MEPVVGLEPTTDGLQNRCSTTELNWLRYCQQINSVDKFRRLSRVCILNLFMLGLFAMKKALPSSTQRKPDASSHWLKAPYPNLTRHNPNQTYFGKVRVNGKLIRRFPGSLRKRDQTEGDYIAAVPAIRGAQGIALPLCPLRSTVTPDTVAKALASRTLESPDSWQYAQQLPIRDERTHAPSAKLVLLHPTCP